MTTTTQEKYELTITADNLISTDTRFDEDNLNLGDNYEPIDAYFVSANNEKIYRQRNKGEMRISNQTLPRLACQIFERQIFDLSDLDKKEFPVCKYSPKQTLIRGIFPDKEAYRDYKKSMEFLIYRREGGPQFVIYSWNIFSTLVFVQECLKRFGKPDDKFILIYREKSKGDGPTDDDGGGNPVSDCKIHYSKLLLESKNLIFRGAPGTGKSYLAKQIAADIISNGYTDKWADLTEEQRRQVEFVQFHPSYDYSDFVEGLRPKMNEDGSMGFELKDGIFKSFVDRARRNFEDSQKPIDVREKEMSSNTALEEFFADIEFGEEEFKTIKGNKFTITNMDDKHIYLAIPGNETVNKLSLNIDELRKMLESGLEFNKVSDITKFFGKQFGTQNYSYDFALFKAIKEAGKTNQKAKVEAEPLKKFIFIIDEINRGEISKILGELFFAIDPGYRGQAGEVATQYSNMHVNPDEKFYIPENVYIIGTMNDIDRSVDSFDFAMRRRFRFVEVRAESTQDMLDTIADEDIKNEAIARMDRLNAEILKVEGLNDNYQIGASYFLKLKYLDFDDFWTDYLEPLLQEYVRGLYDEKGIMKRFARAYGYSALDEGATDEAAQN
ncbi:AAA family ATPase [Mogibacterium diversum]|uniref:AAA family ATPase n=1 Tax=Mogibacterium diversum TaxID=114527 RepID=UPI0026EC5B6B|nr:AAA family ATPase [Mogibacterium diversum]